MFHSVSECVQCSFFTFSAITVFSNDMRMRISRRVWLIHHARARAAVQRNTALAEENQRFPCRSELRVILAATSIIQLYQIGVYLAMEEPMEIDDSLYRLAHL